MAGLSPDEESMKLISLFTGAGGLDLGLEVAKFETVVAVEFDKACVETLKLNRPSWKIVNKDITTISPKEILDEAGLKVGEAELLAGGPPCQPFSKSGYWASGDSKRLEDPRAKTLTSYLKVLEYAQPKAFLLENVPGMKFKTKSEGFQYFLEQVEKINERTGSNYRPAAEVLNAVDYGVPQARQRVFIVGARDGTEFKFPEPTHFRPGEDSSASELQPFINAWDAIGSLEKKRSVDDLAVKGKWADLLPSIPEGQNYLFHTERGNGKCLFGWRTRYWSFLQKLKKDLPSWTITAQPGPAIGPFHWNNRRLSREELARLQTFPDDYNITGSLRDAQRQLGNAVPSALAELIGLSIRAQFFQVTGSSTDNLSLIPNKSTRVPKANAPKKVAKKYLELIGDHAAHPGTGLGPGAKARNTLQKS